MIMKKILFTIIFVATGMLFAACTPEVIEGPKLSAPVEASALQAAFAVDGQFADAACTQPKSDGNFIKFHTSPAVTVQISNKKADGSKNILTTAASGVFNITPKRGNPSTQAYQVTTINQDGTTVSFEATIDVFVPSELEPGVKLLAGDGGFKAWKWYELDGSCWGNAGYIGAPDHGADVAAGEIPGLWWGCRPAVDDDDNSEETFLGQLAHSGGINYGDTYTNSYMIFDEDGNIISYKPDGTVIRKGSYTISNLDRSGEIWPMATLSTGDPAILFPFAINTGGQTLTEFEVAYIDDNLLTLIGNNGSTAWDWSETTWWRFKNASDAEAALSAYDTRKWTYYTLPTAGADACWGNGGYIAAPGEANWASGEVAGAWWGCPPADLEDGQIDHAGGVARGYGSDDAYMVFNYNQGTVTSFDKDGNVIESSGYAVDYDFAIDGYTDGGDPAGNLETDPGKSGILYPFAINTGGAVTTKYQIPYVDGNLLILIGNYNGCEQWDWGEMTWWRFKPVK